VEIVHAAGRVTFHSEVGTASASLAEWCRAVLGFAEQVEAFYRRSTPKVPLDDDYDEQGWTEFWREWRERQASALASQS